MNKKLRLNKHKCRGSYLCTACEDLWPGLANNIITLITSKKVGI